MGLCIVSDLYTPQFSCFYSQLRPSQYVTANAIYFTSGGKLVSYIDPHHLDRLELIQLVDPTARSHG